ncbi:MULTISPECIES: rhodanese-like domain-containing protein [unclassified Saccharicrinis]|uniref:rhodanese-like domain-containing protein n=1 Tax=unclassified Saccharicrinis TaxID=2646859 RepID=UPI003D33CDC3
MGLLNFLFGGKNNPLKEIIQQGATIIDVRTPDEFKYGHVDGSINIPLDQIEHKMKRIRKMKMPLVLCCASGIRSANATHYLKNNNIADVYNGGRWSKVDRLTGQQ